MDNGDDNGDDGLVKRVKAAIFFKALFVFCLADAAAPMLGQDDHPYSLYRYSLQGAGDSTGIFRKGSS